MSVFSDFIHWVLNNVGFFLETTLKYSRVPGRSFCSIANISDSNAMI